ncbi:peroxide stress protein YaaA, partial [uncultured Cetobacterium sp.]|uniref:peroxide stress protein YaaA n=1 Tax=uncultured Cetobacterium sp. TaxID=527638 RepID=UPI002623A903
ENSNDFYLNLASKEFSKIIDKNIKVINIEFRQNSNDTLKNISTEAKKARGLLLNYLIKNNICNLDQIKDFKESGYKYSNTYSNESTLFFIK